MGCLSTSVGLEEYGAGCPAVEDSGLAFAPHAPAKYQLRQPPLRRGTVGAPGMAGLDWRKRECTRAKRMRKAT